MRKTILMGWTVAVVVGISSPSYAQRIVPDQAIRKHLANSTMANALSKTAAYGEVGKIIAVDGWQIIKVDRLSSVGVHKETGAIATFNADPNRDGSTKDATMVVMQMSEFICPSFIASEPRLAGEKPSFDVLTTAIVQGGKVNFQRGSRVVNFTPGSAFDVLLCKEN